MENIRRRQEGRLDWFPRMRAMSLDVCEAETSETNEARLLNVKLDRTQVLIEDLSRQLNSLKEEVSNAQEKKYIFREFFFFFFDFF